MAIKVSQLSEDTSPTSDDYVLAVDNATAASKKVTMGNLVQKAGLPSQASNSGKYLTTDGTTPSWGTVAGGSGSGITRSIVSVTSSTTLGSTAATDYVALVGASGAPVMPTAVGNTNLYVVTNVHSTNKTISTTSSQTINGSTAATIIPNQTLELISDNANWHII